MPGVGEHGPPGRGSLSRIVDGKIDIYLEFQFNPASLNRTLATARTYTMPPGGVYAIPMSGAAVPEQLSFELLLYAREGANRDLVTHQLAFLQSLLVPVTPKLSTFTQFSPPPLALLTLGTRSWYVGVDNVQVVEEQFDRALRPIRARASISATEVFVGQAVEQQRLLDVFEASVLAENVWVNL